MPIGGKYSRRSVATIRLQAAVHFESGKLFVQPDAASPSYCSGATYLVFLKTIEALRDRGDLQLEPGDARVSHDSRTARRPGNLGPLECERPGDGAAFLRAWARAQLRRFRGSAAGRFHEDFLVGGSRARGARAFCHLSRDGEEGRDANMCVIGRAIFRWATASVAFRERRSCTPFFPGSLRPRTFPGSSKCPALDPYLASLERVRSSYAEAKEKCGM